jgi:hypothetical protein
MKRYCRAKKFLAAPQINPRNFSSVSLKLHPGGWHPGMQYAVAPTTPITLTKGVKYGVEIQFNATAGVGYPLPCAGTYTVV